MIQIAFSALLLSVLTICIPQLAKAEEAPELVPYEQTEENYDYDIASRYTKFLGQSEISFLYRDEDVIRVRSCRREGETVSAIRLRVLDHRVHLNYIEVVFGNGRSQRIRLNATFRPGQTTRWMDLAGRNRCVQEIRLKGRSDAFFPGTARVQVYGLVQDNR